MINDFWFSSGAAGGGGGDPGDPIGESLRFRGAQYLQATLPQNHSSDSWSWSCWVKFTEPWSTDAPYIVSHADSASAYSYLLRQGNGASTGPGSITFINTPQPQPAPVGMHRDTSAWYHVVWVHDTDANTLTLFVNGELYVSAAATNTTFNKGRISIGARDFDLAASLNFNGYMAAVYFIDGQALDPTAFGRYNTNGVWVPRDIDFNGTWGDNGFHLDFSDPNDLGADRSGNGNDFTATGFNTDPVGVFSNNCAGYVQPFNANSTEQSYEMNGPAGLFDGSLSTNCRAPGAGFVNVNFNPALTGVTGLKLNVGYHEQILINGTVVVDNGADNLSANSWVDLTAFIPANGEITQLAYGDAPTSTSSARASAIEITDANGTRILVDNTGEDYDLMQDSPTQNYATLNPLDNHGGITSFPALTAANLQDNTTAASGLTGSTIHWNNENAEYYFEFVYTGSGNQASCAPGLRTAQPGQASSRNGANSFYYRSDGRIVNGAVVNAGGADLATGAAWTTGDVLGTAFNPSNNRLRFFKNGAEQCDITITPSEPLQFGVYNDGITGVTVNYGQKNDFLYQPAGTAALQTQNLPEATIANGRDHFQAITDTGANILTAAQTAFPNGLWWIKDRANSNQHQLVDSVRGATQAVNLPSSGNGEVAYSAPTGDSVAWCWSVDGPASANNDGSIETQVAVNSDAGFSIITYTGDGGAASTIGHGLGAVPEFYAVWVRTTGQSQLATARHKDLTDANKVLYLTSNSGEANYAVFGGVLPTDSVITVQGNLANNTNGNGLDFVMYAWTSVPGYSAFGSYKGNQSSDGPFIYTGFAPAFVLLKGTDLGADWIIQDSARQVHNPRNSALYPNSNGGESTSAQFQIDFLSNGFKLRTDNATLNQAYTYAYAAFALNPFQAPVTAR